MILLNSLFCFYFCVVEGVVFGIHLQCVTIVCKLVQTKDEHVFKLGLKFAKLIVG